ncbi:hypothetical protein RIN66_21710 (plasmid) [Hafnia alvei]|nr:hypothetical protein [Hafnia alvei]WNN54735.1 hypothetical protein RIN66_21710 [Hafnia alvei]
MTLTDSVVSKVADGKNTFTYTVTVKDKRQPGIRRDGVVKGG